VTTDSIGVGYLPLDLPRDPLLFRTCWHARSSRTCCSVLGPGVDRPVVLSNVRIVLTTVWSVGSGSLFAVCSCGLFAGFRESNGISMPPFKKYQHPVNSRMVVSAMNLVFFHCDQSYITDSSNAGKSMQCVKCQHWFVIPAATDKAQASHSRVIDAELVEDHAESGTAWTRPRLPRRFYAAWITLVGIIVVGALLLISQNNPRSVMDKYPDAPRFKQPVPPPSSPPPATSNNEAEIPPPVRQRLALTDPTAKSTGASSSLSNAPPKPLLNRSLPNGTELVEPTGDGLGTLLVRNGTGQDAYVKLADSNRVHRQVFMTARSEVMIDKISPCRCRVLFASGVDWDGQRFTRSRSFKAFDDLFEFEEMTVGNRIKYATFEITLNPTPEGKAKTHGISEEEFEAVR
jgi:hypothetical protein